MDTLSTISDLIIGGFVFTATLLFLAYWISPRHRQPLRKLITLSGHYLISGSFIFLLLSIRNILRYGDSNSEFEQYALTSRLFGPYWFVYLGPTLFKGLIPQILWIRKIRQSIWSSIAIVPFLLVDFYIPFLYSQRDYFPSSLTVNFNYQEIFLSLLFFGVLLSIPFMMSKKKGVA